MNNSATHISQLISSNWPRWMILCNQIKIMKFHRFFLSHQTLSHSTIVHEWMNSDSVLCFYGRETIRNFPIFFMTKISGGNSSYRWRWLLSNNNKYKNISFDRSIVVDVNLKTKVKSWVWAKAAKWPRNLFSRAETNQQRAFWMTFGQERVSVRKGTSE